MFSLSFCIWRSVSGAAAVFRWARACASVALCPDGLALARWLRCVSMGSRLRFGCAAFLPLQYSWPRGSSNQGDSKRLERLEQLVLNAPGLTFNFFGLEGGCSLLFSRFFCLWRSVSGAEAMFRWARACASVALCPDGLALARWLRCVPMGSRLRVGCAAFLLLQWSGPRGRFNQRF